MDDLPTASSNTPRRDGVGKAPEVATFLKTTPAQLSRLRYEGIGPKYVRLGRSIRYRWSDVFDWIEANVVETGGAQ